METGMKSAREDAREDRREQGRKAGEEKVLVQKQPVGNAVVDQDVEAGVQQDDLQHTACGGVFALDVPCVLQ